MRSRHRGRAVIVLASILAVAAALAYCFAEGSWRQYWPSPYALAEQPLVDRALDIYGAGTLTRKESLRKVYPVVVRLPEMTCVGLNPRLGRMAHATTICFRDSDGTVVLTHDS